MRQGQGIARYGGVTNLRSSSSSRAGNPTEIGAFITWRELDLDSGYDLSELY